MTARVRTAAPQRWAPVLALALAFALAVAQATTASAAESKGRADVLFSPEGWVVEGSASGPGTLELVDVTSGGPAPVGAGMPAGPPARTAAPVRSVEAADGPLQEAQPGLEVRESVVRMFLARASTLTFRLSPDPGMGVAGLVVDGMDATLRIGVDGTFSMPASDARASIEVAFGRKGPDPSKDGSTPLDRVPITGDGIALVAIALAIATVAAGTIVLRARTRHGVEEGARSEPDAAEQD